MGGLAAVIVWPQVITEYSNILKKMNIPLAGGAMGWAFPHNHEVAAPFNNAAFLCYFLLCVIKVVIKTAISLSPALKEIGAVISPLLQGSAI
jgi:hypothetical protein